MKMQRLKLRSYFDKDEDEDEDAHKVAKDGDVVSIPMMFADAQSDEERRRIEDGRRQLDAEKEEYTARISNAWRGTDQAATDRIADGLSKLEAEKREYDAKLVNAWKTR